MNEVEMQHMYTQGEGASTNTSHLPWHSGIKPR